MKKIGLPLISLLLCFLLCGCWNRREISKIAIVMGFAVDAGKQEDELEITAQIANTRTIASASEGKEGGGAQKPYLNLSSSGDYVFPAIRNSVTKSGARLYMAHNYVVLFGEELARRGLDGYMDFFLRDHELRLDMNLLVAREKAGEFLEVETGFQSIPALHIHDLVDAQSQLSTGMPVTVLDFMNHLATGRGAGLIPIIEVDKKKEKETLRMSGTAVFDGGKMIGELSEQETRGLLWAKNAVKQAVIMADVEGNKVGIEVVRAKGTIEVDPADPMTMVIRVEAIGSLASQREDENLTTGEGIDMLLGAFAGEIEKEIRSCLEKGQSLGADVFDFSEVLYRRHPKLWEQMQDADFHAIPVRIQVKTKLDSSGRIGKPVK